MLSAALTAFVTGITEPLEFAFMFCAPLLYGMHIVLTGVAFMFTHILQITVGQTFSGGLIDFLLFGVLQGNAKTNWLLMLPLGVVMFCLYYFSFRFLIKWRQLNTPGREDDAEDEQPVAASVSGSERAAGIVQALGAGTILLMWIAAPLVFVSQSKTHKALLWTPLNYSAAVGRLSVERGCR